MNKSILLYLVSFVGFMLALVGLTFFRAWQVNPKPQPTATYQVLIDSTLVIPVEDSIQYTHPINLGDTTERLLAVLECASCHPAAYEGWREGPHAASYVKLIESYQIIQESGHYPKEYAEWTKSNLEVCFSCHASQNVFETRLSGIDSVEDQNRISHHSFPEYMKMALPRPERNSWSTGTDCFTCHYNGDRIITRADFKPSEEAKMMEGYCDPMPTSFFNSNYNCVSCHSMQVESTMRFIGSGLANPLKDKRTNCLSCHQEYDSKGKSSHYFYWRHDDPEKHKRSKIKGGIFQDLKTSISRKDDPTLIIEWANLRYPHNFSECGEIAVFIQVKDVKGNPQLATEVRLNRKEFHDPTLREQMNGVDPPGVLGYPFNPGTQPLLKKVKLPEQSLRSGTIELVAIDKGQYWANDAIGDTIWTATRRF